MTQEPGTLQCFCGQIVTVEYGTEIDALIMHILQYHTPYKMAKELAQGVFGGSARYTEGPNQTMVKEKQ